PHPCPAPEEARPGLALRCSKAGISWLRASRKIRSKTIGRPGTGERQGQAGKRRAAVEPLQPRAAIHQRRRREQEGPIQYHLGVVSRHHRYQHLAFPETAGPSSQSRRRTPAKLLQPEVEIPFAPGLDTLLLEISGPGGSGRSRLLRGGLQQGQAQPPQCAVAIEQPFNSPLLLAAELSEKSGD